MFKLFLINRKDEVVKRHEKEIAEEKKRREKILSSMVNIYRFNDIYYFKQL